MSGYARSTKATLTLVQVDGTAAAGSECSLTIRLQERRFTLQITRGDTIAGAAALRSEGKMTKDVNNGKVRKDPTWTASATRTVDVVHGGVGERRGGSVTHQ
jgi:hypothetical protein